MVKKILIFGAGSIGAHHIYAGRSLGCDVYFTDINSEQVAYLKNNPIL
jgi:D-arabinose 1-dehydrogenase-like Zn-dependent alcohol dehydrogenase